MSFSSTSNLLFSVSGYSVHISLGSKLDAKRLFELRELLYQCYTIEQSWNPSETNASQIHTEIQPNPTTGNPTSIFIDNLDQSENSLWVYVVRMSDDQICGMIRLSSQDDKDNFEVDYYNTSVNGNLNLWNGVSCLGHEDLAKLMKSWRSGGQRFVELARLCISEKDRGNGIFILLMTGIAEIGYAKKFSCFTLVGENKPLIIKTLVGLGSKLSSDIIFKFEPQDTEMCRLIILNYEDLDILYTRISFGLQKFGYNVERHSKQITDSLENVFRANTWLNTELSC